MVNLGGKFKVGNIAMKNTRLKRIGLYLLILQFTACQTPVPKLKADAHVDSRLQSPTHAAQVPEKLANIAELNKKSMP